MTRPVADSLDEASQPGPMDAVQPVRHRYQAALAALTPDQWWALELMLEARMMASFPKEAFARRLQDLWSREAAAVVASPTQQG